MSKRKELVGTRLVGKVSFWKLESWQFRVSRYLHPWATWYYVGPYAIRIRR